MKKRFSLIAAALTSAFVLSMAAVPASAAPSYDEQYVTVEDGVTVVYIVTYVDADSIVSQQDVVWYDANGTKYVHTYKQRPEEQPPVHSIVTWYDAAGNKYVLDEAAQTVTVFDTDGNVISVMPAKK